MTTEFGNYYNKFVKLRQVVSKKLTDNSTIEVAICYWSEHFKELNSDTAKGNAKSVYGTPNFQDFSCRFYGELILSCNDRKINFSNPLKAVAKAISDSTKSLESGLRDLKTPYIKEIFKKTIYNLNKLQDHNYLAFLGFICIAISYPKPTLFSETYENTHIPNNGGDFREISIQYFRKIYRYKDDDFDSVYEALITKLDYLDNFLRKLVTETSKEIKLLGLISTELSDEDVKSITADKVIGHLINDNFNKHHNNSKVEFMNNDDIKKIALIFAMVVGAILTIGGAKYMLDQKSIKSGKPKNNLTTTPTTTPLPVSYKTPHILVLMLDGTDSVRNAVDYLRNDPSSKKLDADTVSAISKLTVLQAIWHKEKDKYEASGLKEIFNFRRFEDEGNLIFIEIEMEYYEYDFKEGAGLSNARDGLMKLASNSSYEIIKIVTRRASEPELKKQISALYR